MQAPKGVAYVSVCFNITQKTCKCGKVVPPGIAVQLLDMRVATVISKSLLVDSSA